MARVKRIIYPPVWLAIGIIIQFVFNEYFPGQRFTSTTWQVVGGVFLVVGMALLVIAGGLFKQADTELIPFRDVRALVTTGVFRFSRNPMYLGMLLVVIASGIFWQHLVALAVGAVFFFAYINRFQITPEEQAMEKLFGDEFRTYCERARRWL